MFLKMTGKLLFKACIPLLIVAGISTYVMSSRGGDPVAMWKGFGSGVMSQFASLFSNMKDDASKAADAVAGVADGAGSSSSKRTQVYTWVDDEGVTHYSAVAPIGADSRKMSINPNQNVLAPMVAPKPVKTAEEQSGSGDQEEVSTKKTQVSSSKRRDKRGGDSKYGDAAIQEVADQLGGELPGMAGQVLSAQDGESGGVLNPSQLINMLK